MVSCLTNREAKRAPQGEETMTGFDALTLESGQHEPGEALLHVSEARRRRKSERQGGTFVGQIA
jgi:hypothetical protein